MEIYIPIWLDLLSVKTAIDGVKFENLHSNMVRFIMKKENIMIPLIVGFTFQYG